MGKKFLSDALKIISGMGSVITITTYVSELNKTNSKISHLQNQTQILEQKLLVSDTQKIEVDTKVSALTTHIKDQAETLKTNTQGLQNAVNNNLEGTDVPAQIERVNKSVDTCLDLVAELQDVISKTKFIGNDFLQYIIDTFKHTIADLSLIQLGALSHLLCSIFILTCLFSIVTAIYGNYFIDYLKLEVKYPKLARFIKLRKMFQHYYIILNTCLIVLTLGALIYVNYLVLIL